MIVKKIIGVFSILFIFLCFGWYHFRHPLNITCSSTISTFEDNVSNANIFELTQNVVFFRWGNGVANVAGNFIFMGKSYEVSRTALFTYEWLGNDKYTVSVKEVTKTGRDTLPADFDYRFFTLLTPGAKRVIGINTLKTDDVVLSLSAGPYIICARH